MKYFSLYTLFGAMLLFAIACNQPDPALGQVHKEAVEMTEAMRLTHKGMEEKLGFMKKENGEMSDKMKDLKQPDSLLVAAVLQTEAIITRYDALVKAQEQLIAQNEDFLKKHEKSSQTAAEVQAQHQQIKLNYETVQQEAGSLLQQVEDMKTKHEIVEPPAEGQ